jgi:HK97 family phage prohead protease
MKDKIILSNISNFIGDTKEDLSSIVERKALNAQISMQEDESMTCIAKISTKDVDRDGDILIPTGCDFTDYTKNSVICWDHSYSMPPIGKMLSLEVTSDTIYGKMKFAETSMGSEIWSLIKGGFLKTCSIGFIAKEVLVAGTSAFKQYVRENNIIITDQVKRIITKFTLIENSIVSIPANQEALVIAVSSKSLKLDDKLLKELGIKEVKIAPNMPEVSKVIDESIQAASVEIIAPVAPVAPEVIWNVIRNGSYITTSEDKIAAKKFIAGKII